MRAAAQCGPATLRAVRPKTEEHPRRRGAQKGKAGASPLHSTDTEAGGEPPAGGTVAMLGPSSDSALAVRTASAKCAPTRTLTQ